MASYLKLSARLSIPIADFYSNDGQTTFITNICAFLVIDTGRMKIVGLRSGSTVVDVVVNGDARDADTATETSTDAAAELAELRTIATRFQSGASAGSFDAGAPIISTSL